MSRLRPPDATGLKVSTRLGLVFIVYTITSVAQPQVLTANYNVQRTNSAANEAILNPRNVNVREFGKLFSLPVDGTVYAQPLYVSSVLLGDQTRNLVIVATMHNSVYAFDADSAGPPVWQTNFGPAVPSEDYAFHDIVPEVGILSTPVIDLSSKTIFVVANLKRGA